MCNIIKKLFAFAIVCMMAGCLSFNASAASIHNFTDVHQGQWFYTAVDYAVNEGLFSGTSATTFSPNTPMTRAMFVRVLGNKAGVDAADYPGSYFLDVPKGTWYTPYVQWAAGLEIVNGVGGGKFAPNQSVTREQMALILYNYAKTTGCDLSAPDGQLEKFSDGYKTSGYARTAMKWAISHHILNGSGGKLMPQGTATRAQVAQIFYSSRNLLAGSSNETTGPTPVPTPNGPGIPITEEVRAKLRSNQDPEKILDYVLNGKNDDPTFSYDGTSAQWEPNLADVNDIGRYYLGSWENVESDMRSSSVIANGFVQMLTRTASDRFFITANDADGCFCLYYHPADKSDSQKMEAVKAALSLPDTKQLARSLSYEAAGWAGPLRWDLYGAQGIADKIEYYLLEFHPYTTQYYITEPEPGVFYLLYG